MKNDGFRLHCWTRSFERQVIQDTIKKKKIIHNSEYAYLFYYIRGQCICHVGKINYKLENNINRRKITKKKPLLIGDTSVAFFGVAMVLCPKVSMNGDALSIYMIIVTCLLMLCHYGN